jgi:hypothetical protein
MSLSELIKAAISDAKRPDGSTMIQGQEIDAVVKFCEYGNNVKSNYENAWFYLGEELMANKRIHKRKKVLFIIDRLVHESSHFRTLVGTHLSLISKSAGLMKSMPLAVIQKDLAKDHTAEYEEYIKELICLWDILYGLSCPSIHIMKRYLEESLKLPMPNLLVRSSNHQNILR